MEDSQPLEPVEESKDEEYDEEYRDKESRNEAEESMPMPFGIMGIAFLCTVLQYSVLLGLTMLVLMLIGIFGPS